MPIASPAELAIINGADTVPIVKIVNKKPVESTRPVTFDDRLAAVWAHGKDLAMTVPKHGKNGYMNPFLGDEGNALMAKLEAAGDVPVAALLKIAKEALGITDATETQA
jgi:hypothetical protein